MKSYLNIFYTLPFLILLYICFEFFISKSEYFPVKSAKKYSKIEEKGDFWVLYNFVRATTQFERIDETITLSAPADFRFLDNVVPLVEHWNGPISISLYAPGYDFQTTLDSIAYLRNCENNLIRSLVTFHIFFEAKHFPEMKTPLKEAYVDYFNCEQEPPYKNYKTTYKKLHKLLYPINVARNIARESAQTNFVFASDIELYPSKNFISNFLSMINRNRSLTNEKNVFVLPIFELISTASIPNTKTELIKMINNNEAFSFHHELCLNCHMIPEYDKWVETPETDELDIFVSTKRHGTLTLWEPFYVGTKNEPEFGERFTWEGQLDKMSQAYSLCLLDYNFLILNNAFVVHKPGMKTKHTQDTEFMKETEHTKHVLIEQVERELNNLYGRNDKCERN